MSLSEEMEQACREGNHEVVKKILSSHPESLNFSDEVGNLFVFYILLLHSNISMIFVDFCFMIVISEYCICFDRIDNKPPYILPV